MADQKLDSDSHFAAIGKGRIKFTIIKTLLLFLTLKNRPGGRNLGTCGLNKATRTLRIFSQIDKCT